MGTINVSSIKNNLLHNKALPSGGFFFSTHSLYLEGIINHKSIKMKKIISILTLLFFITVNGQTLLYDNVFIKANDVQAYDDLIKNHFSKVHKERVKKR